MSLDNFVKVAAIGGGTLTGLVIGYTLTGPFGSAIGPILGGYLGGLGGYYATKSN